MAEIVGMIGVSHSPFYLLNPPTGPADGGAVFVDAVSRLRSALAAARPDVLVVLGPDHFHASFYDCMPPFLIGADRVTGFGDYGSARGEFRTDPHLAREVFASVTAAGFDPALSLHLTVDHGLAQPYELLDVQRRIPMLPVVINTSAPPLPGLRRCHAFGAALGAALRATTSTARVVLVGSGGLSHWIPSSDPDGPEVDPARRAFLVDGRDQVEATAAERERRVASLGGRPDARLAPDWDRTFLDHLARGELDAVLDQTDDVVESSAGNGGHEIRTWLAAAGAWGGPASWTAYEPVPAWITGMGAATSLSVPA